MNRARTEVPAPYSVTPLRSQAQDDDLIIAQALSILESRVYKGNVLDSPQTVRDYLKLRFAGMEREEFIVVFVSAQNQAICCESLFKGTLTQTSVYPREVVKAALRYNAHACIFAHNHPSGIADPSRADELLTQVLKQALALVDIRVLDHFVVAGPNAVSFAERGLL